MNVEEFRSLLHRKGKLITKDYLGVPWEFRYRIAYSTHDADFGCDFLDGKCTAERNSKDYQSPTHVNWCCHTCYDTVGNILYLPDDDGIIEEIASLFDPEIEGFWRRGIGCTLPHKYRSALCSAARCSHLAKTHKVDLNVLKKMYDLRDIRACYKRYIRTKNEQKDRH